MSFDDFSIPWTFEKEAYTYEVFQLFDNSTF